MGYLPIKEISKSEYIEKRSRFIGVAIPCRTEEEALNHIAAIKTEHWDARHNCYAFVVEDGKTSRFSDDGEPHGTAGKPILEVINGKELKNVLVVVTRYFGGVLLGTGGLVRAYTAAAKGALENGVIAEMIPCTVFKIRCEYTDHQSLLRLLEKSGANIKSTDFAENVTITFALKDSESENFSKNLTETFSARLSAEQSGTELVPFEMNI